MLAAHADDTEDEEDVEKVLLRPGTSKGSLSR